MCWTVIVIYGTRELKDVCASRHTNSARRLQNTMVKMESPKKSISEPLDAANSSAMENRKLKVLQLGKFYPILGGVEKVMYDLTLGFAERPDLAVACDMMCASVSGEGMEMPLPGGNKLICCRTWKKVAATMLSPAMVTELKKRCAEYDVVHVHHPDPMACLALYLSGYRGKVVLHWHSDILKQKLLFQFYRPLQHWLLRRADLIVGTTPVYLAESPHLAHMQHKTRCLPIGVDAVSVSPAAAADIRERYHGKKIVFSLGRLVDYKGFKYLVEAARYLPDDYVVLIGGSGPLKADLQADIARWGLKDKVRLLGYISDEELPAYYGACHLFCMSSIQKTEAFGIVQIEAMSCGKPVVATRIPQSGVSWVNAHGESGLNAEPEDAEGLARCIMEVTASEKAYRDYAARAEQRYQRMFTKKRMIESMLDIYANL